MMMRSWHLGSGVAVCPISAGSTPTRSTSSDQTHPSMLSTQGVGNMACCCTPQPPSNNTRLQRERGGENGRMSEHQVRRRGQRSEMAAEAHFARNRVSVWSLRFSGILPLQATCSQRGSAGSSRSST